MSTPEMLATVQLIRHLYVDLGQDAGGPLHGILDHGDVDDHWLVPNPDRYKWLFNGDFDRWAEVGEDVSDGRKQAIKDICEQILEELRPMSVEQRHATVDLFRKGWRMHQSGIRWIPNGEPEEAS